MRLHRVVAGPPLGRAAHRLADRAPDYESVSRGCKSRRAREIFLIFLGVPRRAFPRFGIASDVRSTASEARRSWSRTMIRSRGALRMSRRLHSGQNPADRVGRRDDHFSQVLPRKRHLDYDASVRLMADGSAEAKNEPGEPPAYVCRHEFLKPTPFPLEQFLEPTNRVDGNRRVGQQDRENRRAVPDQRPGIFQVLNRTVSPSPRLSCLDVVFASMEASI